MYHDEENDESQSKAVLEAPADPRLHNDCSYGLYSAAISSMTFHFLSLTLACARCCRSTQAFVCSTLETIVNSGSALQT